MIAGRIKEGYGIVQRDVMCMQELSVYAKAVYALFSSYTGQKNCCYPTVRTICRNLKLSRPTITNAIKELEQVKLLEVERTLGESSVYYPRYIMAAEASQAVQSPKPGQSKEETSFTNMEGTPVYIGFEDHIDKKDQKHIGFWNLYDKKTDKQKTIRKWQKLPLKTKAYIMQRIPLYKAYQPNKQYRKSPYSYLLNECWNDEDLHKAPEQNQNQDPLRKRLSTPW